MSGPGYEVGGLLAESWVGGTQALLQDER
jgi:hypothetical protein